MKVKIKPCIKVCLFCCLNIQYSLNVHLLFKCVTSTWIVCTSGTVATPSDFELSLIPLKSALLLSPVSPWTAPYLPSFLSQKPEIQPRFHPLTHPVHESVTDVFIPHVALLFCSFPLQRPKCRSLYIISGDSEIFYQLTSHPLHSFFSNVSSNYYGVFF